MWVIWPKKGGLALLKKLSVNNEKTLVEDALKFLFDCEYNRFKSNYDSLSEHLNLNRDKAENLMEHLKSLELVKTEKDNVLLTDVGRSYALRIVRVHRIWERYFADYTSIAPEDWHSKADIIEHKVTEEETELLASRLGHPVYDPHGDPIPTAEGVLPKSKGISLSKFNEGETGCIIHLEDEPQSIYEQLIAIGLYLGLKVYVTKVGDNKITFVANGEECVLTPNFANYVTVERTNKEEDQFRKRELLSDLKIGEEALVMAISPNCRGQQRRRLMDLGIIPGSKISAVMISPSGDPVGYRVMGTTIGIRKQHAEFVFVNRKN